MLKNPDHITIVVDELDAARAFLTLLGFEEVISTVISGQKMTDFMGIPDIEADHVTMLLKGSSPRFEVQLLHYHRPSALPDPHVRDLNKLGFNHLCFAVDDIEKEVARLKENGVTFRNEIMDFHGRKLIFLEGPGGVTLELAQWA